LEKLGGQVSEKILQRPEEERRFPDVPVKAARGESDDTSIVYADPVAKW